MTTSGLTQPAALSETEGEEEELGRGGESAGSAGTGDQELTPAERARPTHLACKHNQTLHN